MPNAIRLSTDSHNQRQGFIGKEKDSESALADSGASLHGVRKYESSHGRFTGIDPLW